MCTCALPSSSCLRFRCRPLLPVHLLQWLEQLPPASSNVSGNDALFRLLCMPFDAFFNGGEKWDCQSSSRKQVEEVVNYKRQLHFDHALLFTTLLSSFLPFHCKEDASIFFVVMQGSVPTFMTPAFTSVVWHNIDILLPSNHLSKWFMVVYLLLREEERERGSLA